MKTSGYIDYAAVKAAVSFEQIIEHYGLSESLSDENRERRGCCPIHKGTNPSEFSVTPDKKLWNCFTACGRGGNHLEFVMVMENCSLNQAAWKLNAWFALGHEKQQQTAYRERIKTQQDAPAAEPTAQPPKKKSSKARTKAPAPAEGSQPEKETGENTVLSFTLTNLDGTHPYLKERGLNAETIAHFGIGHCRAGIMAGRIAIPIHNASGQVVANAGRWPGEPPEGNEKYRLPAGFSKTLEVFNLHRAAAEPDDSPLVIVEGFFPVCHLWQHGVRRVVSLMGSHLSERQAQRIAALVTAESRILLMLDNDDAGREALPKILPQLAGLCFVKTFRWPEGITQPDGLSPEQLAEILPPKR